MAERRVVVAGGAGFIGSHICDELLRRGDEVVAVDSFVTSAKTNLAHAVKDPKFSLLECDITEPFRIDGDVDLVLNLASPASPRDYLALPIETLQVGSAGTKNLLDLAEAKSARFFLASTSEVYGDPVVHPQVESYWGNVNPIGPRSVYDEAKRFAEALTMAYHRARGVEVRIARIFNTYGERLRPGDGRVVSNFLFQAITGRPITIYGDGSQTRSFCYVADEVAGLLALADGPVTGPINIGNPGEFTIAELASIVLEVTGSTAAVAYEPLPQDDPTQRRPDIAAATQHLGWEPTTDLRSGLERTGHWLRSIL